MCYYMKRNNAGGEHHEPPAEKTEYFMITRNINEYRTMLEREGLLQSAKGFQEDCGKRQVTDISYNSILSGEGTLFICKGKNFKGQYLTDALGKGATGYVADERTIAVIESEVPQEMKKNVPVLVINDMRRAISKISAFYFDRSWDKALKIIGLTGTKGKSTTAAMIKSILDVHCGREIGFSSGIYNYDGENREKSVLTTPETIELHRILDGCVRNDCRYLVMEVSSQALKYDRTLDLDFEIGGFLNISEDHISEAEHKDMEDYFTSKLKILDHSRIACVNYDMEREYLDRVLARAGEKCRKTITFGFREGADVQGLETEELTGKIILSVRIKDEEGSYSAEKFTVNIGGGYNSYNALMAIAASRQLGVPIETIKKGLETVKVPGRMELYTIPEKSVDIIVDYAHNKMSYEALFDYVHKHYPGRRVGFVFGCVGEKAFNRRKEAGEIAEKNADFVVITELDPGKEDINKICQEVLSHIEHKEKARIITNRDEAVEAALKTADKLGNCVVVLAGCGTGGHIKRKEGLVEFATDGERVQRYLASR